MKLVKIGMVTGHTGALLNEGRVKIAWATFILHFIVFRSLSFGQLSVVQGNDIPPSNLNSTLIQLFVIE